jgi:hypothetical protein
MYPPSRNAFLRLRKTAGRSGRVLAFVALTGAAGCRPMATRPMPESAVSDPTLEADLARAAKD